MTISWLLTWFLCAHRCNWWSRLCWGCWFLVWVARLITSQQGWATLSALNSDVWAGLATLYRAKKKECRIENGAEWSATDVDSDEIKLGLLRFLYHRDFRAYVCKNQLKILLNAGHHALKYIIGQHSQCSIYTNLRWGPPYQLRHLQSNAIHVNACLTYQAKSFSPFPLLRYGHYTMNLHRHTHWRMNTIDVVMMKL